MELILGQDEKVVDDALQIFRDPRSAEERYGGARWGLQTQLEHEPVPDLIARARIRMASDDRWAYDFGASQSERTKLDYESNVFLHRPGDLLSWTVASTYFQDQRSARLTGSSSPSLFRPPFEPFESARTVSLPARVIVSGPLVPVPLAGKSLSLAAGAELTYDVAANLSAPRDGFRLGPAAFPDDDPQAVPPRRAQRLTLTPLVAAPLVFFQGGVSSLTQVGARFEGAQQFDGDTAGRMLPFVASDWRVEFGRTFRTRRSRVRHSVRPEVNLLYVPDSLQGGSEVVAGVLGSDAPPEGHTLEVSVVNRILYRSVGPEGRGAAKQILDMRVGQQFGSIVIDDPDNPGERIREARNGVPFATVRAGYPGFTLRARAQMDEEAREIDKATVFIGMGKGRGPAGLSGSYSFGRSTEVHHVATRLWVVPGRIFPTRGGVGQALRRLRLEGGIAYDLNQDKASSRLLSISGALSYVSPCDCWSISFSLSKDADRDEPGFSIRFQPRVPRSTRSVQPMVAGEER
jgi:hypothetical protein